MILKPIDQLVRDDIEFLVTNAVAEGRTIDYKEALPGNSDGEKKEFLADVSSFANASGGDILYGMRESRDANGQPTGISEVAQGLAGINVDAEILRLENLIQDGIEPRISGLQMRAIDGFPSGPVLLLRVPKSWASPHMVTFKSPSRFFARNSAGKYPLDVTEIRAAFALSAELPERIRGFRDDRLARIVADETPVRLARRPKIVLHLLPLTAFALEFSLEPAAIRAQRTFGPIMSGGWNIRYNVDGLLAFSPSRSAPGLAASYCQVFRTGAIEAVDTEFTSESEDRKFIPSASIELSLIQAVKQYLDGLSKLGVPVPVVILISMLGVASYGLEVSYRPWAHNGAAIDRDTLRLPDVIIEDFGCDVPQQLRPIFDALWNAAGWERCFDYDDAGNWNVPQ